MSCAKNCAGKENIMVKKITNNDLNEAKKGAAVVDFSAVWCGPCQMLAPVMEELSEELSGKAEFYNADSDENMELAQEYRIVSIPAVIVLKDGVEVARTVGFQTGSDDLRDRICVRIPYFFNTYITRHIEKVV